MPVEAAHALELGDALKVGVDGQQPDLEPASEGDELGVDLLDLYDFVVEDVHVDVGLALQRAQQVEAPLAAPAPDGVLSVGNRLELVEDEARHQQCAAEEASPRH